MPNVGGQNRVVKLSVVVIISTTGNNLHGVRVHVHGVRRSALDGPFLDRPILKILVFVAGAERLMGRPVDTVNVGTLHMNGPSVVNGRRRRHVLHVRETSRLPWLGASLQRRSTIVGASHHTDGRHEGMVNVDGNVRPFLTLDGHIDS